MSDSPTHSFDAFLSYSTHGDFLLVVDALNERPSLNWRVTTRLSHLPPAA
jgi:hypothetical protein